MNFKKLLALLLAAVMVLAMAASCTKKDGTGTESQPVDSKEDTSEVEELTYDEVSAKLYDETLGEFYQLYREAKAQEDLDMRFAMMAQAEAKLLESAVMLPLQTQGGNYAISKAAPYTIGNALWGNDSDRFHNIVVADKLIPAEERDEMKAKFAELKGTGEYEAWVKEYLTGKGYSLKDTYTIGYPSDPKTWDAVATSRAADSEAIVNTYDGLYEYDCEGTLKPALAESYEVSEDGTVYTFKIREGAVWVDSQGRKVADVKADDFVAGMQHMLDAMGGLEYLVQGIIVNASEYIEDTVTDFAEVGVKALDDYTLEYTLTAPCSYFMTMLSYNVFAPLCRDYYVSQGGKFGTEYNAEDEAYKYGKSTDTIAYCGPYVVTNATAENTIVFQANESYWNKDNINIKTITWLFNDGTDATKGYKDTIDGVLDGSGLNSASLEVCKSDGNFDKYAYVSATDATSFMAFNNINRAAWANVADETVAVSSQTEEQKAVTKAAMQNVHFRRALVLAVDRAAYNAQTDGEELKLNSLRNSYTPGNFVSIENAVTVDINGTATEFAAATYYGEIMQAQLDADGFPIKVWDAENLTGDSFDGWYNPEAGAKELEAAIAELAEAGVTIDAENPVYLDLPAFTGNEAYLNRANAYKQSIETNLGGKVIINLVECAEAIDWYNAGYYTDLGSEANYDIYDVSGWGPDYGDPATYLDTFLPEGAGYMIKCIGIY